MTADLKITAREQGGATVLSCAGDLDIFTCPAFRNAAREAAERGSVVIDLTPCTWLDSTGLGVMVGVLKLARQNGYSVVIACSADPLVRLFRITGLVKVFSVEPTVDEAVAALEAPEARDA